MKQNKVFGKWLTLRDETYGGLKLFAAQQLHGIDAGGAACGQR